jgi:hypothetical protein
MESVIACSYSLYWEEAVQVIRLCMLRNPWLPESVEVLGCIACQHQFGSAAEKGWRKVGCSSRSDCYSLLLHTLLWTVEENTCLGEEGDRPGELKVYAACRVHFRISQQMLSPSACSVCWRNGFILPVRTDYENTATEAETMSVGYVEEKIKETKDG